MLSETQKDAIKQMEKLQAWEVIEVIREWSKRQIAQDTFAV